MMRVSLVSLGQKSASSVYSFEMAKALASSGGCDLQIIISAGVENLDEWKKVFENSRVDFHVIQSYRRNVLSAGFNMVNFIKQEKLVRLIKLFAPDILYLPFGLIWARYVFFRLHNRLKIISTIHDPKFHDKIWKLSVQEFGSYIFNIGSKRYVDSFIILNNQDRSYLQNRTKKPVSVIPHASYSYYFQNHPCEATQKIHKCIAFFGRIEPYKGLDLLVDALNFAQDSSLRLIIAGSGKIDNTLRKK